MKIVKIAGKALGLVLTAALLLLLCCNLYLIAAKAVTGKAQPTLLGFSAAVVVSGSMSGAIEVDDMILCRSQPAYVPGDIISFESGSSIVTHRIVEVGPKGYVTRGDANNVPDADPVPPEKVVGRVVLVLPGVGRWIARMRTPLGMTCFVLLGVLLIELPALAGAARNILSGGRYHGKHEKA